MLRSRILRFISDATGDDFDDLARETLLYQLAHVAPYRRLCESRGLVIGSLADWRDATPAPTLAFKSLVLAAAPAEVIFRSSGTRGERSVHHQPFPELYRAAIDNSFPGACLRGLPPRPPMLSLIPDRQQQPDSSLSFMVDHLIARHGAADSHWGVGRRGLELGPLRSWLGARQRDRRATVVLATSFALVELLDGLERLGLRFRLPPGSVLFETGGTKGRSRALEPAELTARVGEHLGLPSGQIVREYGMTELSSQCYTAFGSGAGGRFTAPHWLAVRVLDPVTLKPLGAGEEGLLSFFDLANLGSVAYVLTEDRGVLDGDGFQLLGRAPDAELRGCSLTAEELAGTEGR